MSIKRYCDQCGVEIVESIDRLKGSYKRITFEVMIGTADGAWNSGDWCKYCIITAVKSLDDRPTDRGAAP